MGVSVGKGDFERGWRGEHFDEPCNRFGLVFPVVWRLDSDVARRLESWLGVVRAGWGVVCFRCH